MLEKFIFENHLGQRIDGSECGLFLNYNDLRDYSWSYDTLNGKISRFRKDIKNKKLPLVSKCNSEEEAIQAKNRLLEIAEADIYAMIPGKIYIGDYYMSGYITESKKSDYLISKSYTRYELTFTAEKPVWLKEKTYIFGLKMAEIVPKCTLTTIFSMDGNLISIAEPLPALPVVGNNYTVNWNGTEYNCVAQTHPEADASALLGNLHLIGGVETGEPFLIAFPLPASNDRSMVCFVLDGSPEVTLSVSGIVEGGNGEFGGIDYPYDYEYDYALPLKGEDITCNSVGENAFRICIYGEAVDPSIIIGEHTYTINGSIGAGETLLIDSLSRTITLTTEKAQKVNWFDKRSRESYIFQPIPPGTQTVRWSGNFGFDLTVIEERSEPKWT